MNVLVLIVFFLFAGRFHQALYLLIPVLTLSHLYDRRSEKLYLSPILRLYLTVVVIVALFVGIQSVLNVDVYWFSIKGLARYFTYFLFAVLVSTFEIRSIELAFKTMIILLLVSLPWGVVQVLELGRYQNVFQHGNHLAYVLDICIYFTIFHKPFKSGFQTIAIVGLIISLALTKSSGGILVLLTLLAYNLFISKRISFNTKAILLVSFLLGTFLVLKFSEKVALQLNSLNYLNWDFLEDRVEKFRPGGYGSIIWRVVYWIKIHFAFMEEPLHRIVFGIGVDHLSQGNMPYAFTEKDPHNDFIKVLVEFGGVGLLLFLGFFRKLYRITAANFNLIILLGIPMFFGNAIVNFPFNLAFILLITYEFKRNTALRN